MDDLKHELEAAISSSESGAVSTQDPFEQQELQDKLEELTAERDELREENEALQEEV